MPKKEFGQPDASERDYGSSSGESEASLGERLTETVRKADESLGESAEKAGETVDDVIRKQRNAGSR
jgi:hypothetical protein